MPADLLAAGMLALSWNAMYLVHSTILLAGTWLFLKIYRRAGHGLRETLWKGALAGSVVTASVQMLPAPRGPFGAVTVSLADFRAPAPPVSAALLDVAGPTRAGSLDASFPGTHPGAERDIAPEGGEIVSAAADIRAAELSSRHDEIAISAGPRQPQSPPDAIAAGIESFRPAALLTMAVAIGLVAIVLGVGRCLWQTWSLRRKLARCSIIASGPARRFLDELRQAVPGAPDVRLLSAPDDPEPAAFGIRRWTIVLPARAVRDLSEDELRALLAHELAHLVRGDSLWLLISRVVCSCLAFQPLNHLARREWQRAAEYLCDSWAVSCTGTPLALARCLAEVAGWRLSGQVSAALLAATGRKSGLADRIERLVAAADLFESRIELRQRRRLLLAGGILLGMFTWYAPRLQLAVAAPDAGEIRTIDPGQEASAATHLITSENGPESGPAAAKPQAGGEGSAETGDTSNPAATETRAPVAEAGQQGPASDLGTLLLSLDRDLSALERELRELEVLLAKEDATPDVSRVANRLRQEIAQLKQRRNVLNGKWKGLSSSPFAQK